MMRKLAEMSYELQQPFVLDISKYESTFSTATTQLATAVRETIKWYQPRSGNP